MRLFRIMLNEWMGLFLLVGMTFFVGCYGSESARTIVDEGASDSVDGGDSDSDSDECVDEAPSTPTTFEGDPLAQCDGVESGAYVDIGDQTMLRQALAGRG